GGSGFGRTAEILKPLCAQTAKWRDGKMLNHISDKALKDWVAGLS
ncbi:MAG TPA: flavodoxin, partial [Clostridiales bacterium]|nr:flavodoxin [Clostridiales bacterium]